MIKTGVVSVSNITNKAFGGMTVGKTSNQIATDCLALTAVKEKRSRKCIVHSKDIMVMRQRRIYSLAKNDASKLSSHPTTDTPKVRMETK